MNVAESKATKSRTDSGRSGRETPYTDEGGPEQKKAFEGMDEPRCAESRSSGMLPGHTIP